MGTYRFIHPWTKMAYTQLIPRFTSGASVEKNVAEDGTELYHLSIPAGNADEYRLSQVDNYAQTRRSQFPLHPPLTLSLAGRASSENIPGTWGFGLWNDPFGLSLGFGGNPFRLPTLPNAVWFFGASNESYLSFRTTNSAPAANGFIAQSFRSPGFHPLLFPAGMAFPFSRKTTRRLMGRVIVEDGVQLNLEVTQWHRYRLDWREDGVSLYVDEVKVIESLVSPKPPLGLVIWIDNQYAAFTPEGKIGFGVLENPEPAWLEIKDLELNK